jgi:glutamine synthetase
MENIRYSTLEKIKSNCSKNGNGTAVSEKKKLSDIFAEGVFTLSIMKEYISEAPYHDLIDSIKHDRKIAYATAESVAKGLKRWALDMGATHYTHWFQPLTGTTAEKHDAFYKPSNDALIKGIEGLSASELIQREPDASSFPSGGLRNTSEARGYTIWDASSPAFILETETGKTLYVPSIFISYTGEALDHKTPLLKSSALLDKAATAVCKYFDSNVQYVTATLGWEQEYFVIDADLYKLRPDLILAGRTLFGNKPPKGQQLEDHYFGSIPEKVQTFMIDFEREALKLGIPVLTRHNEVAPNQFECAPMFEELNVAIDHNLLLMDVMNRVAKKHGLKVLFHEKPFTGVNGSGKHNNWSMATNAGKNLLSPGSDPGNNLQFLTFIINIIKAVHTYEELIRASIATAGNDHRLGANEAPPAIISVFTGSLIETALKNFQQHGLGVKNKATNKLELNIPKTPELTLDNTDRNRTSPFPFTGNKFEFRAVGSSANCSHAMMVLNTIVANQLIEFKKEVDQLVSKKNPTEKAIIAVLQKYLSESEKVIFNGNGYSADWEKEAKKRGLSNHKNTPAALQALLQEKTIKLFEKHQIFNKREVHARYEIAMEEYVKKLDIEAELIKEIATNHINSAAYNYVAKLTNNYRGLKEMGLAKHAESIKQTIDEVLTHVESIKGNVKKMEAELHKAHAKSNTTDAAFAIAEKVKPLFDDIRTSADALEIIVEDNLWNLPKYRELLFVL